MKQTVRMNITNACGLECSFCPIYCSENNRSFLGFEKFKEIIDTYKYYALEVVLEGGEPFLNKRLYLFIEYLAQMDNLKKVTISTPGLLLSKNLDNVLETASRLTVPVEMNIAITSELIEKNKDHLLLCKSVLNRSQINPFIRVSFKVRYSTEEDLDYLLNQIDSYGIPRIYLDIHSFQAIGRLKDSEYPMCKIPNDGLWVCYASDGECFHQDLVARAEHEKNIANNMISNLPVFDAANHKRMWMYTVQRLHEISFENKHCIDCSIFEYQRQYIASNLNFFTSEMLREKCLSYAKYYATRFPGDNYCDHDPFVPDIEYDCCAENITREFFLNEQAMMRTTDVQRFYENKMLALQIAEKIANLPVRGDIRVTIEPGAGCSCPCCND